jgi:AcrR family transcriptional regulator
MASVSKEQWIEQGLETLRTKGYSELSIVKLAKKLGVTRGSFYYHFSSLNELIDEMIANWEEVVVNQGFDKTFNNNKDPISEFNNLIDYVTQLSDRLDLVFRQWAPSNAHVRSHMERLDKKRLERLTELFQRLAEDDHKGKVLAQLAFNAYIGNLHTYPASNSQQQYQAAHDLLDVIKGYLMNEDSL